MHWLFFNLKWSAVEEGRLLLWLIALLAAPLVEVTTLLLLGADIRRTPFYRLPHIWAGLTASAVLLPLAGTLLFLLWEQITVSLWCMLAGGLIALTGYTVHIIHHRRQGVTFGRSMWIGAVLDFFVVVLCILALCLL